MKRIDSAGCGYVYGVTGLTCTAVPKLDPLFANTIISAATTEVGDRDVWVWPESGRPSQATADNYAQIPQSFEGFVMTMAPIIDMSGGSVYAEVPEIACRVNTDPFKTQVPSVLNRDSAYTADENTVNSGFIDLFNQVDQYTQNVYVSVVGNTDARLHYTIPMMVDVTDGSTVNSIYTVKPGILDPMVDTQMPNVGLKTIPAIDAGLDGAFLALDRLQQWRRTIDNRITYLTEEPDIFPQKTPCDNFGIELVDGEPYQTGPFDQVIPPKYRIRGGEIRINGYTQNVYSIHGATEGQHQVLTSVTIVTAGQTSTLFPVAIAPFAAYLDVFPIDATVGNPYSAVVSVCERSGSPVKELNHTYVYVGGVTEVTNEDKPVSDNRFTLYEIDQGDCITDVELHGGSNGYMYMTTATNGGRQYTTDPLLDYEVFKDPVAGTENAIRGVQAEAIQKYVEAHGGGSTVTADWVGYPNYAAYGADINDVATSDDILFSDSWLLPVHEGTTVAYMTGATTGYHVTYAPSVDSGTGLSTLTQDTGFAVPANGWVRIRVFDDGSNDGSCLRFGTISGSTASPDDWSTMTPIYRFGQWYNEYDGPFKVSLIGDSTAGYAAKITGVDATQTEVYAGKIFFNGTTCHDVSGGTVALPDLGSTHANIYAYVADDEQLVHYSSESVGHYAVRLAKIRSTGPTVTDKGKVIQCHFGDIYVDASTATTIIDSSYNGPFKVDGNGSISCPACLDEGPTVGGHYWLNGIEDKIVLAETVPLTAATQNIYIHITGATTYTIDTTKIAGNTNAYTAWLAHIDGATVTGSTIDVPIEGSTETEAVALYGGGTVTQIQHGDIYVDGRWM